MICNALGLHTEELHFTGKPAVGRITVSSPAVMWPLKEFNQGEPYADLIKPFNFMSTCHVKAFGHPPGADPEHFHLIAPYQPDPKQWTNMEWIDQYSRKSYRIAATGPHGTRFMARVKTYGMYCRNTNFTRNRSAPIRAKNHATNKPLAYCNGVIFGSGRLNISVRNPTAWKMSNRG